MFASHQMINDSGLRELERFLDKQDCTDKFGGLVQCVDYNNEILWLCEEHRFGYRFIRVNESNGTQGSNGQQTHFDGRELVRDHVVNSSLAKKISILYHDIIEILEDFGNLFEYF
ncbi:hypothetical protein RhiirA5_397677 [Rhizophagus irregularis]|uniref:Uncharacterized protein n=2 Tax=Rhizophagus irregularis TaxID=588596 RepID=A0A2N0S7X5_9GLOM|nr:hypothetical protein GLOIN_2v1837732 [Rhizophagus irregularis DAOM 181602=DAOM 197198]PKC11168.1 hypothetical protein RhiirA5_397677 [Rhizophagus irregularis]PKC71631.1 hypothetical protein RhiirA1_438760 [Rhizophagus irregularis]POG77194.1 hypothetical protein GLOIN_2v1837732 [Rhizophagus irregularis DAOM 181602=DAOM 197198]|eukprot:XP_025184060.1 hypothetical protein GLOIN_2v1837732 [Rhizophagus irregularis DAOM 181602=DAOM 197198]